MTKQNRQIVPPTRHQRAHRTYNTPGAWRVPRRLNQQTAIGRKSQPFLPLRRFLRPKHTISTIYTNNIFKYSLRSAYYNSICTLKRTHPQPRNTRAHVHKHSCTRTHNITHFYNPPSLCRHHFPHEKSPQKYRFVSLPSHCT